VDSAVTYFETSSSPTTVPPPAPDPAVFERSKHAARARRARHRRRLLETLWSPRHVEACEGSGKCAWAPTGRDGDPEPCPCRAGLPCACGRALYEALQEEGRRVFGPAVAGLVGRTLLDLRLLGSDHKALDLRVRLIGVLLADARGREDLAQRQRRLDRLDGDKRPYAERIEAILTSRRSPALRSGEGGPAASAALASPRGVSSETSVTTECDAREGAWRAREAAPDLPRPSASREAPGAALEAGGGPGAAPPSVGATPPEASP
jgi:hypothetical protein